ncbi:unnamed protein product, partial [Discosporangium mesarthrocarpum]
MLWPRISARFGEMAGRKELCFSVMGRKASSRPLDFSMAGSTNFVRNNEGLKALTRGSIDSGNNRLLSFNGTCCQRPFLPASMRRNAYLSSRAGLGMSRRLLGE